MQVLRNIWKQAPAIVLLLIVISGWLAVPVSLAAPEPITCGMVCCEESGECCCFISRQELAHENGETDDGPQLAPKHLGCAANCATPPSSSTLSLAQKNIPPPTRWESQQDAERLTFQPVNPCSLELCCASVPRAPPLFS